MCKLLHAKSYFTSLYPSVVSECLPARDCFQNLHCGNLHINAENTLYHYSPCFPNDFASWRYLFQEGSFFPREDLVVSRIQPALEYFWPQCHWLLVQKPTVVILSSNEDSPKSITGRKKKCQKVLRLGNFKFNWRDSFPVPICGCLRFVCCFY